MNDQTPIDGLLRAWFAEDAAPTAPAHLAARVAGATQSRRQQPTWLARLTGGSVVVGTRSRRRMGGLTFVVALLAATAVTVTAGAMLWVGGSRSPASVAQVYPSATPLSSDKPVDGSPTPAPSSRIYTSSAPWEFYQPTDVCGAGTGGKLPPGPLPQVGPPSIAHPHNGMITLDGNKETLVNPAADKETSTLLPGASGLGDGDQWSPDGHWLAIGLSERDISPSCTDVYVISSDGTRLVDVTGYPSGDQPISVAWSPDSKWLAVARWVAVPQLGPTATGLGAVPSDRVDNPRGTAIDVLGIGPDGSVVDARRVWTSDAQGIGWLSWSSRGDLAWSESDSASSGPGLFVLRTGQTDTTPIDLRGAAPALPYSWSEDGQELVAIGSDASDDTGGIYVIVPAVGTVRFTALANSSAARQIHHQAVHVVRGTRLLCRRTLRLEHVWHLLRDARWDRRPTTHIVPRGGRKLDLGCGPLSR